MSIFRVQYFWIHYDYDDYGYAVVVVLVLRYYTLSPTTSIGLFQKKIAPPLLRISIFLNFTPWISSQIYRDPPGIFNFFFALTPPLEIHVFSSIFGAPPGIPTTFPLPPGFFHWYPQQGGYNFFSEKDYYAMINILTEYRISDIYCLFKE